MDCYVQDIAESDPIIWKKNKEAIYIDEDRLTNDERIQAVRNFGVHFSLLNSPESLKFYAKVFQLKIERIVKSLLKSSVA